jgi:hypothetical protein
MTDLTRPRGDTYADEFVLKSKTTGQPINLAGYSFKLTVNAKKDPGPTDAPEFQINGVITDEAGGKVEFAPTAADADRLGNFHYDIQMVDGAGRKRTLVKAKYGFTQDITKD